MATNYYTKKFTSMRDLSSFLNFGGANVIEEGEGYISGTNLFTATSQENFSDWEDIDGGGTNLSGYLFVSGQVAGDQFTSFGTVDVASASTINLSGMTNIGSSGAPKAYKIYDAVPTFSGTIVDIIPDAGGYTLIWTKAAPIHLA